MKLNKLMIAPLLCSSFLLGACNNDAKYKVTFEEFDKAVSNDGIEYVQVKGSSEELSNGGKKVKSADAAASPFISYEKEVENPGEYSETYYHLISDEEC